MSLEKFEKLKNLQQQLKITIKKNDKANRFKVLSLKKSANKTVVDNSDRKVNILSNVVLNTGYDLVSPAIPKLEPQKSAEGSILYQMLNTSECINEPTPSIEAVEAMMVEDLTDPSGSQSEQLLQQDVEVIDMGTEMLEQIIEQPRRRIGGKNMNVLHDILEDLGQIEDLGQVSPEDKNISPLDIAAPKGLMESMLGSITEMRNKFASEQAAVAKTVDFLEENLRSWKERLEALNLQVDYLETAFSSLSKVV